MFGRAESKELPEKGEYKGVPYRIDGDSIMLKASSGKEVQFAPDATVGPQEFDSRKQQIKHRQLNEIGLTARKPSDVNYEAITGANTSPSLAGEEDAQQMWGISRDEIEQLTRIAEEINTNQIRARAK